MPLSVMDAKMKSSGYIKVPAGHALTLLSEQEITRRLQSGEVAEGDSYVKVQIIKKMTAVKGNIDLIKVPDKPDSSDQG